MRFVMPVHVQLPVSALLMGKAALGPCPAPRQLRTGWASSHPAPLRWTPGDVGTQAVAPLKSRAANP